MRELTKIERARYFAIASHGSQKYGTNTLPYYYHLEEVYGVLEEFGWTEEDVLIGGLLHDILEDCPVSYNDIKEEFGERVAEFVYSVTDELGRNRKERKDKTYPKIVRSLEAVAIKLADRIANIRNAGMKNMYTKEHPEFKKALYYPHHTDERIKRMWREIEELIL